MREDRIDPLIAEIDAIISRWKTARIHMLNVRTSINTVQVSVLEKQIALAKLNALLDGAKDMTELDEIFNATEPL